jgi:uncharacterized protein YkwD
MIDEQSFRGGTVKCILIVLALLLITPVIHIAAQSLGFREDCISFDVNRAVVRRYSASWKIVVGDLWLLDFGENEQEARRALAIIKHYGLNKQCFVGRPGPSLEYYLADGGAPTGSASGEDCMAFNPDRLEIRKTEGRWKIAEGKAWLLDCGSNRTEAEKALKIIRYYGFTNICYVGRPQPSLTYLRTGQVTGVRSSPPATEAQRQTPASSSPFSGSVIVYGSATCGRCKSMKQSLEQAEISYLFYDINQDKERQAELWRHINRAHPGTTRVSIPIVVVGQAVLIDPSFQQVQRELANAANKTTNPEAPSTQPVTSSWNESLYSRHDFNSFNNLTAAKQRIDLKNIDYPLLQAALFYETNRARVKAGKQALAYHPGCAAAAQMHAKDMATGKFFSHENPYDPSKRRLRDRVERFDIRWHWIAENINQGMGNGTYIEVARQYVDSWMNSSGHRANMLSTRATHMGTGAFNAGSKYSDLYFDAVQVFAHILD